MRIASTGGDVLKVLEGVLFGFGDGVSGHFESCVDTDLEIFRELKSAVEDLESDSEKRILEALKKIGESIKELPKAIEECKAVYSDMKHLKTAIESMASPWTFAIHVGKDIVLNGVSIFKEVKSMIKHWKAKEFFEFGKSLGKALEMLIIGNKPTMMMLTSTTTDVFDVLKGVLVGFGDSYSPNFEVCLNDDKTLYEDMREAIKDF